MVRDVVVRDVVGVLTVAAQRGADTRTGSGAAQHRCDGAGRDRRLVPFGLARPGLPRTARPGFADGLFTGLRVPYVVRIRVADGRAIGRRGVRPRPRPRRAR
ncbi:hypothetical protein BJF85_17045 [Saccharomonospora sp. CUA-673]|nr:hypothetical protein BJF85_17045 [Saccharomonospora sp. CUA-673]